MTLIDRDSILSSQIGQRIKAAAKAIGGNKSLAARLGVTEHTVGNYVRGRGQSIETLLNIAEITGSSFIWLATGEEVQPADINVDVLKKCIEQTEQQERERGVSLDPEGKASVIAGLYSLILKNQNNKDTVQEPLGGDKKKRAG